MNPYLRIFRLDGHRFEADVYDVLRAFEVNCPATAHAAKKLLCAGIRGHKSRRQDLIEARIAIERAIEMEGE